MADATSTFTVRGKADVDDAVRGLNKLGDEAKDAGEKAKGMGDYFRATVAGILSAETAMKGVEIVLSAVGAGFDFARNAALQYMTISAEGQKQTAQFNFELTRLKNALGEAITESEGFGDGFDAALEVLRDLTEVLPDVVRTLDNYYLTAVKVEEVTSGFVGVVNTLGDVLYNVTPFAAVSNAFGLVSTAAGNVTEIVGEAEREIRDAAAAAAESTPAVNGFAAAWGTLSTSIGSALAVGNLVDFFFAPAEAAPEATTAVTSYAAAIDYAAIANEKLKQASEDATAALAVQTEAMNAQDAEWMTLLEGFNARGEEERERVNQQIAEDQASALSAAIETKGKVAAAMQPAEDGGFLGLGPLLQKDYDAAQEGFNAIGGAAQGLGGALSSGLGAALASQEKFGKAFKAALGQALVSQGISELLTGASNMIPFGPQFNPVAGAARLALGGALIGAGKAMGGKGGAPGGGGGGGGGGERSVGESSGLAPMAQPQRQGPTNLIDYSGVTIVTNDTDSMRTLIDRQSRTAATGGTSRV